MVRTVAPSGRHDPMLTSACRVRLSRSQRPHHVACRATGGGGDGTRSRRASTVALWQSAQRLSSFPHPSRNRRVHAGQVFQRSGVFCVLICVFLLDLDSLSPRGARLYLARA